jgi:hypothetical protein
VRNFVVNRPLGVKMAKEVGDHNQQDFARWLKRQNRIGILIILAIALISYVASATLLAHDWGLEAILVSIILDIGLMVVLAAIHSFH